MFLFHAQCLTIFGSIRHIDKSHCRIVIFYNQFLYIFQIYAEKFFSCIDFIDLSRLEMVVKQSL